MLITFPNIRDVDGVYESLTDALRGLDDQESDRFNARLILILMNHIGDEAVIHEAIKVATSPAGPAFRSASG